MIIGILAESSNDSEPLKEILRKILSQRVKNSIRFITHESNTGIFADMDKAAKIFFDTDPKCDIAIYLNDLDNQPDRCKKIRLWADDYCSKNISRKIVVGCPDPTLEQWFIREESAIKKILGLDSTKSLPYQGKHPKIRLENMIYSSPDMTIIKKSAYIDIAKNLNTNVLKTRDKSFNKFYEDFMKAYNAEQYA